MDQLVCYTLWHETGLHHYQQEWWRRAQQNKTPQKCILFFKDGDVGWSSRARNKIISTTGVKLDMKYGCGPKWMITNDLGDLLLRDRVKSKTWKSSGLMGGLEFTLQREATVVCLLSIHLRAHLSFLRRRLYQSGHRSHFNRKDEEHQVYHPIHLTAALLFKLWMMLWTRTCWQ